MYIFVIPTKHSLGVEPLTYEHSTPLARGILVEIPYKKEYEYGIVVGSSETPNTERVEEIRPIAQVIADIPLLAKYQILVLCFIAQKYMIPIHRVLGFFLPQNTLRRVLKYNIHSLKTEKKEKETTQERIFHIPLTRGVDTALIESYLEDGTVCICPDDFTLSRLETVFQKKEDVLFLYKESTEVRKAQAWKDIYEGKYRIIFGNRKLLYYNLEAYKKIIYLEDAFGTEYFHYPSKIQYLDVLRQIADTSSLDIVVLSTVSKLTHRYLFRDFTFTQKENDQ